MRNRNRVRAGGKHSRGRGGVVGGGSWLGLEALEPRCFLSGNGVIDVTQGLPDLAVTIPSSFKAPTSFVSGTAQTISLPVTITNIKETTVGGQTITVPVGATTTLTVVATPDLGAPVGAVAVEVGSVTGIAVGGLKVGAAQHLIVPLTFPNTIGGGDWRLVVTVDPTNTVAELGEDPTGVVIQPNNITQTAAFPIQQGLPDLVVSSIGNNVLPNTAVSATPKFYNVPFTVTNTGGVAVAAATSTTVSVTLASELPPFRSFGVESVTIDVSNLAPNASVHGVAVVYFANQANDEPFSNIDQQHFVFTVDPTATITEISQVNNSLASKTITVTNGAPDLVVAGTANKQIPTKTLISGTGQVIKATWTVKNTGNADWISVSPYMVTMVAVPDGLNGPDTSQAIDLTTAAQLSVPDLAPGKSANLTLSGTLPLNMPGGHYTIEIFADYVDQTGVENMVYTPASAQEIDVTTGSIDLQVAIDPSARLPASIVSGNGSTFMLPVDIRNAGNLPTPKGATVGAELLLVLPDDPEFTPVSIGASEDISVLLNSLGAGKTLKVNIPYSFPAGTGLAGAGAMQFNIEVSLVNADALGDIQLGDKTVTSNATAGVVLGNPDLVVTAPANLKLPATILDGAGKSFTLPLAIKNVGNLSVPATTLTTVEVFATPMVNGVAGVPVQVAEVDGVTISNLGPNASRAVSIPITLAGSLLSGNYTLSAVVDSGDTVVELSYANNTLTIPGSITVTQGLPDLTATMATNTLGGTAVKSGDESTITLPLTIQNLGNLANAANKAFPVRVFGINQADQTVTEVGTFNVTMPAIKSGGGANVSVKIKLPVDMLTGSYQLNAQLDPLATLPDSGAANNTTSNGPIVNVTRVGADITPAIAPTINLPASLVSGSGVAFNVPVVVTNNGTVGVAAGLPVAILIQAHNQADGADTTNDVTLLETTTLALGGLGIGQSKTLNFKLTLPVGMGPGDFVIVVTLNSDDGLMELDTTNNVATTGPLSVGG